MNNKCTRCSERTVVLSSQYCLPCLCEVVEQRAKKALSRHNWQPAMTIHEGSSLEKAVGNFILRKLRKANIPKVKNKGAISAKSADTISEQFIESFLIGRNQNNNPSSIFERVTEHELLAYASARNIKHKEEKNGLKLKITKFQESHPGTVESIAKSANKIMMLRKTRQKINND